MRTERRQQQELRLRQRRTIYFPLPFTKVHAKAAHGCSAAAPCQALPPKLPEKSTTMKQQQRRRQHYDFPLLRRLWRRANE